MARTFDFGTVLEAVIKGLADLQIPVDKTVFVRDVCGKILVCLDFDKTEGQGLIKQVEYLLQKFAPYTRLPVLCASDLFDQDSIFKSPDELSYYLNGKTYRLLERQITGQDWLRPQTNSHSIPRLAFFSFKGGVGRSTTVAALAFLLAQTGKKIMVFDFDLESPGLASILLPVENYCSNGIVDWLVEDAINRVDDLFLEKMVAQSPLATNLQGDILVIPAMGVKCDIDNIPIDLHYVSKLSRIYADIPQGGNKIEHFADRLERLVTLLEEREQPDIVLIDCRAGLHDLSAGSIIRITDESFFFIVDTPQSWQGYYTLFSHWKHFPKILTQIRNRINIVHTLIPSRKEELRNIFLESSYSLFSNTIYEEIPAGQADADIFNFAQEDTDAPHSPCEIYWDKQFAEFTYQSFDNRDVQELIKSNYHSILDRLQQIIETRQDSE